MVELTGLTWAGKSAFGFALAMLVVGLILLGRYAGRGVATESEYLVADRKVPLFLSILALLATWFGSSSVIESSSKMYRGGLSEVLLDPIACGATLILTGFVFAGRFWESGAATVADLFGKQFGQTAEKLSCMIQVPSFFLWIGSQLLAMGQLLDSALGVPLPIGLTVSGMATVGIVVWGGMWAVTWSNSVMIVMSLASLLLLFGATSLEIGSGDMRVGIQEVIAAAPSGYLSIDASSPMGWLGICSVLVIGLFGNVPGQDIQQRVASAKSARTAKWMCIWAGVLYLLIGMVPLYLGLAARFRFSGRLQESDLPIQHLAGQYLSEPLQVMFLVGMFSLALAVASGATLSQSSIVSRSILGPWLGTSHRVAGSMIVARAATVLVVAFSMAVAYWGESIMQLLELSLVIVLVSLFVPMTIALFFPGESPRPQVGIFGMLGGFSVWALATYFQETVVIPASLVGLAASAIASLVAIKRLELVRRAR